MNDLTEVVDITLTTRAAWLLYTAANNLLRREPTPLWKAVTSAEKLHAAAERFEFNNILEGSSSPYLKTYLKSIAESTG